ncbi:MAG: hypothetical protein P4L61_00075 [Candidatus Pacebacteria bacterium]|nr:hypothetical protein [Candidatus Paceibacterota bacterium]
MNEKISIVERIGNFMSLILLGNTKKSIIRTEEKVNFLQKSFDKLELRFEKLDSRLDTFVALIKR